MSVHGVLAVAAAERSKLADQLKVRLVLLLCVASPFAFVAALRVQSEAPTDTLFGLSVTDSGFAVPLVVLGFAALWALPVLASLVGGDVFSSEDRYGTWMTVLTRSRSRSEVFAGKALTALSFTILGVAALAASSVAAGVLVIGKQPLVDLSGGLLHPSQALVRVGLAWLSVLAPTFSFVGLAVLVSVVTRSSAAGIGVPVVLGLTMQLVAMVDGPEIVRRVLIGSAFGAWHGLLTEPLYYRPLIYGLVVSSLYLVVCLAVAYRVLRLRDVGR